MEISDLGLEYLTEALKRQYFLEKFHLRITQCKAFGNKELTLSVSSDEGLTTQGFKKLAQNLKRLSYLKDVSLNFDE